MLTFLLYGSLGGLLVVLPFVLIKAGGLTAVAAGAALLSIPVLIGLGSPLMGGVTGRYGGRWPLTIGAGIVAVGLAMYARIGKSKIDYWTDIRPSPDACRRTGGGRSSITVASSAIGSRSNPSTLTQLRPIHAGSS